MSDEQLREIIAGVEAVIADGKKYWICDISELTYCNSIGLNLFIRVLTKARNAGGDSVIVNPQPAVKKLFELSKLNEIFTSYASVDEALNRYNTIA